MKKVESWLWRMRLFGGREIYRDRDAVVDLPLAAFALGLGGLSFEACITYCSPRGAGVGPCGSWENQNITGK